jgi:hypothetical protein
MDYVIYCDESRHDPSGKNSYMAIGGLWVPRAEKLQISREFRQLCQSLNLNSEIKWHKVSEKRLEDYKRILDFFVNKPQLCFRVIVVDKDKLDFDSFHNGDQELGFYKFYYEMLVKWLEQGNQYLILLDFKQNKGSDRYGELLKVLNNSPANKGKILDLTVVNSAITPLAQLSDLLTGAVAAAWSGIALDSPKYDLSNYLAQHLSLESLQQETKNPQICKFNIFKIRLS